MPDPKTVVIFESRAFNLSEEKPVFLNPGNFGDDLGAWLAAELRGLGCRVDPEIGQEDFGWHLSFETAGKRYTFVFGNRDPDTGEWVGWLERDAGLIASLFGRRKRGIDPAGPEAIHTILSRSPKIENIAWHTRENFEALNEEAGSEKP
jgi:hypothetical protein